MPGEFVPTAWDESFHTVCPALAPPRATVSHLERNETVQRLKERIACHGCLDADVSAIGRHQLVMEPLFALGSGLKRDDDRAHVAPPHGRALTAAMAVLQ